MSELFKIYVLISAISTVVGGAIGFLIKTYFAEKMKSSFAQQLEKQKAEYSRTLESEKAELKSRYDHDLEKYKSRLKTVEIILPKKLDALKDLYKLYYEVVPDRTDPDMEWHEACLQIAGNFNRYERKLIAYKINHGNVLDKEIADLLQRAHTVCTDGKFEGTTSEGIACAEVLYDNLSEAVKKLEAQVQ